MQTDAIFVFQENYKRKLTQLTCLVQHLEQFGILVNKLKLFLQEILRRFEANRNMINR